MKKNIIPYLFILATILFSSCNLFKPDIPDTIDSSLVGKWVTYGFFLTLNNDGTMLMNDAIEGLWGAENSRFSGWTDGEPQGYSSDTRTTGPVFSSIGYELPDPNVWILNYSDQSWNPSSMTTISEYFKITSSYTESIDNGITAKSSDIDIVYSDGGGSTGAGFGAVIYDNSLPERLYIITKTALGKDFLTIEDYSEEMMYMENYDEYTSLTETRECSITLLTDGFSVTGDFDNNISTSDVTYNFQF